MTEPDTDADDDQTDDQFDTTIDARDVDADDSQGPPNACPGCGRQVTLMGNGFCGFCQDREGDADEQDPDVRADGGVPEPEILDVVDAPEGYDCQLYGSRDEAPAPCSNDADFLFVYQGSTRPDVDIRRNALACSGCFKPPTDQDVMADGGTVPAPQQADQDADDWERAAKGAADLNDLVRCGTWLAAVRGDVVIGTSDDGERAAMRVPDALNLGVRPTKTGSTTVQAGGVTVDAVEVAPVRADGGATKAPDADALPDPSDARRAVVDAARKHGVTCQRGAFAARRATLEPDGGYIVGSETRVVVLEQRVGYGGDVVGIFPVVPFHHLRDDWTLPTPDWHERGDDVVPADRFDVDDLFVDASALPGSDR